MEWKNIFEKKERKRKIKQASQWARKNDEEEEKKKGRGVGDGAWVGRQNMHQYVHSYCSWSTLIKRMAEAERDPPPPLQEQKTKK